MPKNSFIQIQRGERLFEQVVAQIEKFILSGAPEPGYRLPSERELCEQFGVSRTVVREAVRILEAKGLLSSQGGSGSYVRAIESSDVADSLGLYLTTQSQLVSLNDLMEIRRVLEIRIAALAAERSTEHSLHELENLLRHMGDALNDSDAFARYDLEFHVGLARATGNELFALLLDPFMDALYEARRLASELPGVPEEANMFHYKIFQAVKAGDPDAAAEAMLAHLDQANRVTKKAISEQTPGTTRRKEVEQEDRINKQVEKEKRIG